MKSEPSRSPDTGHDHELPADHPGVYLSALADGDPQAAQRACGLWRDEAQARATWHAYHLIGDVMRSDELARPAARDAAFLASLRLRLATEPVVLAPVPAPVRRRQPWLVPAAAAAGFVVVAGVLVVTRAGLPSGAPSGAAVLATASAAAGVQMVSNPAGPVAAPAPVHPESLIRDARLDEYLRAHQLARGGVAVAAPGGSLRRVDIAAPAGPER